MITIIKSKQVVKHYNSILMDIRKPLKMWTEFKIKLKRIPVKRIRIQMKPQTVLIIRQIVSNRRMIKKNKPKMKKKTRKVVNE